jgi:HSP20 family protein
MQVKSSLPERVRRPGRFLAPRGIFDRMLEDWFTNREFDFPTFQNGGQFVPDVDVQELEDEIRVTVELPGLTEKDVEVMLTPENLTIRGEKHEEKEEKERGYYRCERSFGSFHRDIGLPCEVRTEKSQAKFEHGVLTIALPKSQDARRGLRKIEISAS